MGEDERADWLSVAMTELLAPPSVPAAYFRLACAYARRVCDHPSKIMPAIFKFDPGAFANRRFLEKELSDIQAEFANMDLARLEADKTEDVCTPEQAKEILEKHGMRSVFADLGNPHRSPPRTPTADELAEIAAQFKRKHYSDTTAQGRAV